MGLEMSADFVLPDKQAAHLWVADISAKRAKPVSLRKSFVLMPINLELAFEMLLTAEIADVVSLVFGIPSFCASNFAVSNVLQDQVIKLWISIWEYPQSVGVRRGCLCSRSYRFRTLLTF
jgi:hypothetical protein